MVLYLLRSILNKELLNNSNGTLRVYNDIQIARADADIFEAHLLSLDYQYILEHRIQEVIKQCIANKVEINVNNVVIQSVFSPGGTLVGKEKQIKEYIEKGTFIKQE